MKYLVALVASTILLASCNGLSKNQFIIKDQDFKFRLRIGGGLSLGRTEIVLNNTGERDELDAKPFVLYFLNVEYLFNKKRPKICGDCPPLEKVDTLTLEVTTNQSDSIFNLPNNFIQSVKFCNIDTITPGTSTTETITSDVSYQTVFLTYKRRTLSNQICRANSESKEFDMLYDYLMHLKSLAIKEQQKKVKPHPSHQ